MSTSLRTNEVAERALAEHTAISDCLRGFEASVSTAGPADAVSRERIQQELTPLIDHLTEHARSAESSGGLLAEVEVALGRSHEVSTARRLHRSAAERAEELSQTLAGAGSEIDMDQIATLASRLSSAIHRHHELEADLILMAFDRDIGIGD